jgi:hypothetical protein
MEKHSIDQFFGTLCSGARLQPSEVVFARYAFETVIRQTLLTEHNVIRSQIVARAIVAAFERDHDMESLVEAGHSALNIYSLK